MPNNYSNIAAAEHDPFASLREANPRLLLRRIIERGDNLEHDFLAAAMSLEPQEWTIQKVETWLASIERSTLTLGEWLENPCRFHSQPRDEQHALF